MTTFPEQAKRIIFPAAGEVALVDYTPPPLGRDTIRIKTLYSLMSIGTETTVLHGRYAADSHFAQMFSFPQLRTGVQALGVVEECGDAISGFRPGELAYMRMGHGSHQVLSPEQCSPIPPGLDLKQACWCGLAKTAFRAAWAGGFSSGGQVLIIGAGPVGQMVVRWAKALGMSEIAIADISSKRLEYARAGGATTLFCGNISDLLPEVAKLNGKRGAELVIEVTGNPAVFQPALAAAARFGKVILLGDTGFPNRQSLSSDLMTKGLTLQATHDSHDRDGWSQRKVDDFFFKTLAERRFPLEGTISHEFSPLDCVAAYDLAERERHNTMGILFDWTQMEDTCP